MFQTLGVFQSDQPMGSIAENQLTYTKQNELSSNLLRILYELSTNFLQILSVFSSCTNNASLIQHSIPYPSPTDHQV